MQLSPPKELSRWLKGWPNKLTFIRILSIPLLILLFPLDFSFVRILNALIFLGAALTDFFDGYLARRSGQDSIEGALLDPIADKMLIVAGLVLLVAANQLYAWVAILLICREIAVSGIRLLALEKNIHIEVNFLGKAKTTSQVLTIFCLLMYNTGLDFPYRTIGMLSVWVTLFLSLYSGYQYSKEFWDKLRAA